MEERHEKLGGVDPGKRWRKAVDGKSERCVVYRRNGWHSDRGEKPIREEAHEEIVYSRLPFRVFTSLD